MSVVETLFAVVVFLTPIGLMWRVLMAGPASKRDLPLDPIDDNRFTTLFINAFRLRCPVCKAGKLFTGWFTMVRHCPNCGVDLDYEPGYFLGSIYFNYGATGVLMTGLFLLGKFVARIDDRVLLPGLLGFAFVFPCWFFRYARSSWMVWDQFYSQRRPEDPLARDDEEP